ncbi:MAG TPA: hypothetical protein PKA27_16630 [Fimbriimonadaceae bacterium]|nr:hypothetical protein [Fimbriimonadaceae bacterium]
MPPFDVAAGDPDRLTQSHLAPESGEGVTGTEIHPAVQPNANFATAIAITREVYLK